jgi:hypothetical protein
LTNSVWYGIIRFENEGGTMLQMILIGLGGAVSGIVADRFARPAISKVLEKIRVWIVWKLTGTQV